MLPTGVVKRFVGFDTPGSKKRRVFVSEWRLVDEEPPETSITARADCQLPLRLRSKEVFSFGCDVLHIYLDLLFVNEKKEICRFVNGPSPNLICDTLTKANGVIIAATNATEINWFYFDGDWKFMEYLTLPNRLDLKQVQPKISAYAESLLAISPTPDQVSSLPFETPLHWRNLARRVLIGQYKAMFTQFQPNSGRQAERFSEIYKLEALAFSHQASALCRLCTVRPVALVYDCFHQVSCSVCSLFLDCFVCSGLDLPLAEPKVELKWLNCTHPKPDIRPPKLATFFGDFAVIAWDGEVLMTTNPDTTGQAKALAAYPSLKVPALNW